MNLVSKILAPSYWKPFLLYFALALFTLTLSRLVFYVNNIDYFNSETSAILQALVFGLQFDLVPIGYLLGPFFIIAPFLQSDKVKWLGHTYFIGVLAAMSLLNCVDAEFFKFTARRSTDDLFSFAVMSNDILHIAPALLRDFWHLLLACALITITSIVLYQKINFWDENSIASRLISVPIILSVLLVFTRGGFQTIPLGIINAGKVDNPTLNTLVLNTPFTILKTIGKPHLADFEFIDQQDNPHNPIKKLGTSQKFGKLKGCNVVILIVESLGKEYIGSMNNRPDGFTPFIDSICQQSFVFNNAFANGHRSIEGIPAIVASIPTLMYEPFITSRQAANEINSLATTLCDRGYYTSFLHGANNGSMGIESFAAHAGFDQYYGRNQYPDPTHYDGHWGIFDHFFLQQAIKEFNSYSKPFLSTVFTLSSHHPYTIPDDFKNRFPKGTLPIHESLGYADESLRLFFKEASKTDWYKNTLFVITADHTSLSRHPLYQTKTGSLAIPIIYFHPNDRSMVGQSSRVTQQADIMPSILDLLGYDKPFFALGTSAFDTTERATTVAFKYDHYQMISDSTLICFDGVETSSINNIKTDTLLKTNLINTPDLNIDDREKYLKGYLQNYSSALKKNQMKPETWQNDRDEK
ncbi:LTA synthase family protein [Bacteroidota bacterium]